MNSKNSKYISFFDNISPDEKLVENTRQMMYSELCREKNSGGLRIVTIKNCGIAALCAAAAAAAVFFAPGLNSHVVNNTDITDDNTAEVITTTVNENPAVFGVSETTHTKAVSDNAFIRPTVESTVSSVNSNYSHGTDTRRPSSERTDQIIPSVTAVPDGERVPQSTAVSSDNSVSLPHSQPEITQKETVSAKEPERREPVSTDTPNFRPGGPMETTVVMDPQDSPCTTVSDNNSSGADVPPEDESGGYPGPYEKETVVYEGITYEIIINKEYEYSAPRLMDKSIVNHDAVTDSFGSGFYPSALNDDISQMRIYASDPVDPGEGILIVSGRQTALSDRNSKFAAVSVSKSGTDLKYSINSEDVRSSEINGITVYFTSLVQFDKVCLCSFIKNDIQYDICFKGYSYDEIVKIINS